MHQLVKVSTLCWLIALVVEPEETGLEFPGMSLTSCANWSKLLNFPEHRLAIFHTGTVVPRPGIGYQKAVIMISSMEKEGTPLREGMIERLDHGQEAWWAENFMMFSSQYFPNGHATRGNISYSPF